MAFWGRAGLAAPAQAKNGEMLYRGLKVIFAAQLGLQRLQQGVIELAHRAALRLVLRYPQARWLLYEDPYTGASPVR